MAKGNQKAKEKYITKTQDVNINKGFEKLIKTFDGIADNSQQTMPLLSSAMRHNIEIVKLYKKSYNITKKKI